MRGIEMPHRGFIVTEFVEDLTGGEMQRDAIVVSERCVAEQCKHAAKRGRSASVCFLISVAAK